MNFLGGRKEHQRHWNIPVPDRNAEQVPPECGLKTLPVNSDVLLTVHLSIVSVIDQYNAQILVLYIFFFSCGAAAQRGQWPPHSRSF